MAAFDYTPFRVGVIAALALLPAGFMLLLAFALRQAAKLAAETRRARALAAELLTPASLAALQAGGVLQTMRREIERATAAAEGARTELERHCNGLAVETVRFSEVASRAELSAKGLSASLLHERGALGEMAAALDTQALAVDAAADRHAQMVGRAADLAQTQTHEAEAVLVARTAALAAAAADLLLAAESAGGSMTSETGRLERAGAFLGERYRGLEATLSDRHAALENLADKLDRDQSALDAHLERQREALGDAADQGRHHLLELSEAAAGGVGAVRDLAGAAADQALRVGRIAREEQDALAEHARAVMTTLADAAAEARRAVAEHAETAEHAAEQRTAAARAEIDQLNEAAFAAGRRADETFEARLNAARRLIDQSAALVDEAGGKAAARIEAGLASSKETVSELQSLLSDLDGRAGRLPTEVQAHADALRTAVAQGVGELTAAARKAADETQAIDAAFQTRVRRNYEMLSEAVTLMGKVAGAVGESRTAPAPASKPSTSPAPIPAAAPASVRRDEPSSEPIGHRVVVGARIVPSMPAAAPPPGPAALKPAALSEPIRRVEPSTLRPRLQPTVVTDDGALQALFEPTAAARGFNYTTALPTADEGWSWKDLLSSLEETPIDDDSLAERLVNEIEGLGVDTAALLPAARLETVARMLQARDAAGARELVRQAAPAAVRRLARRLQTDKVLRAHAERYARRYEELLSDAGRRDAEGFMLDALVGSDSGRAFLLLDAALRDLA